MNIKTLNDIINMALTRSYSILLDHVSRVDENNSREGIEREFARAFECELKRHSINFNRELPLEKIETESYYPERHSGRIDCYLPDHKTAIEYKAIRLPRKHSDSASGSLYDIGQLASDYLRLYRARKLEAGYLVIFVYRPLVNDATSPGRLYRFFHNQMFVDYTIARENWLVDRRTLRSEAYDDLGWNQAYPGNSEPIWVKVSKRDAVGAICIACRD